MNYKKIESQLDSLRNFGWTSLDFRNCGLTRIPAVLFDNPDIVFIDFGNDNEIDEKFRNKITEIPDDIGKIKRLTKLNLENNSLITISDELGSFFLKASENLFAWLWPFLEHMSNSNSAVWENASLSNGSIIAAFNN